MQIINSYTIDELCNENKKIIIKSQNGVEIIIEPTDAGTRLYFLFGNELVKRQFDFLVKPVNMPDVNLELK